MSIRLPCIAKFMSVIRLFFLSISYFESSCGWSTTERIELVLISLRSKLSWGGGGGGGSIDFEQLKLIIYSVLVTVAVFLQV